MTVAPAAATASAVERPIPVPAPVTNTTLPSNAPIPGTVLLGASTKPTHAGEPAIGVGCLTLDVGLHLGVRQDQESLVTQGGASAPQLAIRDRDGKVSTPGAPVLVNPVVIVEVKAGKIRPVRTELGGWL